VSTDIDKLTTILGNLSKSEDFCREYFERAKRYYKLYRFYKSRDNQNWPLVNMVLGRDTFAFVEDAAAYLMSSLFSVTPFFTVLPVSKVAKDLYSPNDSKMAKQLEKCLAFQLFHPKTNFFDEMVEFVKGSGIYGTSYTFVLKPPGKRYLRPRIESIDFWDILPDPAGKRISKGRYLFYREHIHIDILKKYEEDGFYKNIDGISRFSTGGLEVQWHVDLLKDLGLGSSDTGDKNIVEVLHYFHEGHETTIANRGVIIKDTEVESNKPPFVGNAPVVECRYTTVPHEFFGMGIPEIVELMAEDKNLIDSQRRENIDLIINKIMKVKGGGETAGNIDAYMSYPGAKWVMEELSDIQEFDLKDVTQSSYIESDRKKQEMESATGQWGYFSGKTPTHSEQPTTVIKLQEASAKRLDLVAKMTEMNAIRAIGMKTILLTRKYMTKTDYEKIIGEDDVGFFSLKISDVEEAFDVKPVGSSMTNIKEAQQAQQAQVLGIITKLLERPEIMMKLVPEPFTVNLYEAIRTMLEKLDVSNVDDILVKLKEQKVEQPVGGMQELAGLGGVDYGGEVMPDELMEQPLGTSGLFD